MRTRRDAMEYCMPDDHIWVQVVGGAGYSEHHDTKVCIKCQCYSSVVKDWSPVAPAPREQETHPATMIGRR